MKVYMKVYVILANFSTSQRHSKLITLLRGCQ